MLRRPSKQVSQKLIGVLVVAVVWRCGSSVWAAGLAAARLATCWSLHEADGLLLPGGHCMLPGGQHQHAAVSHWHAITCAKQPQVRVIYLPIVIIAALRGAVSERLE